MNEPTRFVDPSPRRAPALDDVANASREKKSFETFRASTPRAPFRIPCFDACDRIGRSAAASRDIRHSDSFVR